MDRKYCLNVIWYTLSLLFVVAATCSCDDKDIEIEDYHLEYYDSLEYMVVNSDMIAYVEMLTGASESGREQSLVIEKEGVARTKSILKLNSSEVVDGNKIVIDSVPAVATESGFRIILRKGLHLVFLKQGHDGQLHPLTPNSIIYVFNNNLYPIWKQGNNTDGKLSTGFTVEVINGEILSAMGKSE